MNPVTGHPVKILVNFMESRLIPSDDGLTTVKLHINEHLAINVFIGYLQTTINNLSLETIWMLNKTIFTVEFLLQSKKMTLIDNVHFFLINSQIISLLKTLDQALIIKEKDFLSCWNCLIKTESMTLLFPVRTDFVDLDLNCYNGNSYKTIQNSWFSINRIKPQPKNLRKTFLPFYKYLLVGGTEKEVIQEKQLLRTRKIKLKLNSIQKKLLTKWSNHHRYSYNKAIDLLKGTTVERTQYDGVYPENRNEFYSKTDLRDLITPETTCSRIPWILETPKHIRESAVFEAHKNLKSAISNLKNGHIRHFDIRYKSKRIKNWSYEIPSTSIKNYGDTLGFYENRTTNSRIKITEKIDSIEHACNIMFNGLHYYICVPVNTNQKENKSDGLYASLDPGVRKFQTIYSPDKNEFIMIGKGAGKVLYQHLLRLDKMLSKRNNKNELKIKKLRMRISDLQSELHFKTSNFLCNNFREIYVPKLTKENDIIRKMNRKIQTKTVRNMVVLGHCKFIERLKTKAEEFTNVNINVISEEFTSQKCLECGKLTKMKKGEEMYKCNFCGLSIDRDILGSTNILLKNW
jgi:putative transposase